ncbi:aldo/keto reductase [Caecibacteroides pullorum]|uniref:Aldo/keto reductase n=1 Tax=Caecibacteroides pullorum TaxID=2725562 RepID=A0AA40ZQ09_9BACT|nr:aldo/keto reductase [Caecibacteroides pullorum]MBM6856045.1 aldo/keto reductase [Caecibacteroides pullorum]MBV8039494.1 aldo/keto reductase [Caecibacteroides pullorum]MBV8057052.1 aldo/keto reductase [Caecibacteroides pullorum]MDC6280069.1 aldo/keto reductase [Caecibacteroides pullorum]
MKTIKLNNGVEMPMLGYGVFLVSPEECERCVLDAISVGYRLIDTAQAYYNEEGVGAAISKCGVPRNELFLTTKVWISNAGEANAARSIDESLHKLKTDYVDLLLIHQPFGDYYGTYRALEKAYKEGKARAIGLSNFYDARFVDLVENMEVKPAVLQLETHVFSQQRKMRELIKDYGTQLMAWGPLAQGTDGIFTNETLKAIGDKYGKTNAQVALKFLLNEGIVAIPKSIHKERMASNLAIDDFKLSEEDMETIRKMDTGKLKVDFNDPAMAKYLINYDKNFNPNK